MLCRIFSVVVFAHLFGFNVDIVAIPCVEDKTTYEIVPLGHESASLWPQFGELGDFNPVTTGSRTNAKFKNMGRWYVEYADTASFYLIARTENGDVKGKYALDLPCGKTVTINGFTGYTTQEWTTVAKPTPDSKFPNSCAIKSNVHNLFLKYTSLEDPLASENSANSTETIWSFVKIDMDNEAWLKNLKVPPRPENKVKSVSVQEIEKALHDIMEKIDTAKALLKKIQHQSKKLT